MYAIVLTMWAGFGCSHAVAFYTVKSEVNFKWLRYQCTVPQFVKNILRAIMPLAPDSAANVFAQMFANERIANICANT